jgi:hypothetical protein
MMARMKTSASRRLLLPALLALLGLAACGGGGSGSGDGGGEPSPAPAALFISLGSLQCTGGGTTLVALERALQAAGVQPLSASCGFDGLVRPAVCGIPDGRIAIFEVPAAQSATGIALGYAALSQLPGASRGPCP